MKPRIAVVGNINIDFVFRAERMPCDGETLPGRDFRIIPGGKAANQAVAAARLGAEVRIIGCVGDDEFADRVVFNLENEQVDCSGVERVSGAHTGAALVVVHDNGRNSILVALGANLACDSRRLRGFERLLARTDVVLVQLGIPLETVETVIELSRRREAPVFLDAAPIRERPPHNWRDVTVLSPNETEVKTLLPDADIRTRASAEQAVRKLLEAGVPVVALKLGAEGCLVGTANGITHVPAMDVDVVDTTAAGDAFMAGLAVSWAEQRDWDKAARFAVAAGAVACTRFGAQPSLPTKGEVERLMEECL